MESKFKAGDRVQFVSKEVFDEWNGRNGLEKQGLHYNLVFIISHVEDLGVGMRLELGEGTVFWSYRNRLKKVEEEVQRNDNQ